MTGKLLTLDRALEPIAAGPAGAARRAGRGRAWQALDPAAAPAAHARRRQAAPAPREPGAAAPRSIFEDLHWIDAETQALLDSLVESLPTARLLLLVNYRPEYQHGWGSKTYYRQLRLDPLPPESAERAAEALLGADPAWSRSSDC